jgi:hypothetical protein
MADATNAGIPAAGGQLSGEATRQAAIARLKKQQSASPNTGPSGVGGAKFGLVQAPGQINQSSTPEKLKRI